MERSVLYLDLPDFLVAVERICDPSLVGRPLLVAGGHSRSRVLCASPEARSWGVAAGMFLGQAQRLCREAAVLLPNAPLYQRAQAAVRKILSRYSPSVEPKRPGGLFVDLTGTGRLWGPGRDTAQRIGREITVELRLLSRLGLSTNKSTSQVATGQTVTGRPVAGSVPPPKNADSLIDVFPGSERVFLAPHPALLLPGAGEVEADLLDELNITIIRQLADAAPGRLALVFGRLGPVLHLRARGCDPRPVRPPEKNPGFREECSLVSDTSCRDELLAVSLELLGRCSWRMREAKMAAATVRLEAVYADNVQAKGAGRISPLTDRDAPLELALRKLFLRTVTRRIRVGYLKVTLCDLVWNLAQLRLLPPSTGEARQERLTGALDAVRDRFGPGAVVRGSAWNRSGIGSCPTLPT